MPYSHNGLCSKPLLGSATLIGSILNGIPSVHILSQ